jgi:hypothetical protein
MDKQFKRSLNELTNKSIGTAMNKDKLIRHQQVLIDMLIEQKDKAENERHHFISCLRNLECFTSDKDIYQPVNNMLKEHLNNM